MAKSEQESSKVEAWLGLRRRRKRESSEGEQTSGPTWESRNQEAGGGSMMELPWPSEVWPLASFSQQAPFAFFNVSYLNPNDFV